MTDESTTRLDFPGLRLTEAGIFRLEGTEAVRPYVPRASTERVGLYYGFQAARPAVQASIGGLIVFGSLWGAAQVLLTLSRGGQLSARGLTVIGAVGFLGALGAWFVYDGLKRGPYLEVVGKAGIEKYPLSPSAGGEAWSKFVHEARRRWGYELPEWPIETTARLRRSA